MGYRLQKSALQDFLRSIMRHYALIAPLRRAPDGLPVFAKVERPQDLERLELERVPQFPAKKFLLPPEETLFSYEMTTQRLVEEAPASTPRVLFGLRLCDLNAFKILDKLFLSGEYTDDHYRAARDDLFLIGWYCTAPPSPDCFCESMKLSNYYDLLLRDRGDHLYVDVGSPRGIELLRRLRLTLPEEHEAIPPIRTQKHLDTTDIQDLWDHPLWERVVTEECLSCQRCTQLCPTCLCFDLFDENDDLEHGRRKRVWDSCHNKEFTRVAGDHYFRPDRTARFKHRIYHKLVYYPTVFGSSMCTGCGRCITYCPPHIDFVEMVNSMRRGESVEVKF